MMKLIILGISVVLINTVITSLIIRKFALQVSKSLTLSENETKLECSYARFTDRFFSAL